jgi:isopentenyl-diphosphate delta-isomerase
MDKVILVDEQDNVLGSMDKMEAHRQGILHRAFSILIFNSKGELLLQKRSRNKYHSGGLWTNACCSHPTLNESINDATRKRLKYEMGIDLQPTYVYKFIYECKLNDDLTEHELDHVFTGIFDGTPIINLDEVEDWKFVTMQYLREDVHRHPDRYTIWFKLILNHPELKPFPA